MRHTACFELSMYPSSTSNKVLRLEIDQRKETKPNVTGECFSHPLWRQVLLCSPDCTGTCCVNSKLKRPSDSTSQVWQHAWPCVLFFQSSQKILCPCYILKCYFLKVLFMNSFLYINVKGVFLSLISLVFFYNLPSDQYYKGFFLSLQFY